MESQKKQQYKTVMVSTETHRLLCKLQGDVEEIFEKKKISFDKVIRWLILAKVDWTDLTFSKEILED